MKRKTEMIGRMIKSDYITLDNRKCFSAQLHFAFAGIVYLN